MKMLTLLSCIILSCTTLIAQETISPYDLVEVVSYSYSHLSHATEMDDYSYMRESRIEALEEDVVSNVINLQQSKLACDFIVHPTLYADRYLLVKYVGTSRSSCLVTNRLNEVVYTHPLTLSEDPTWIDLNHLPSGGYYLNVKVDGVSYQQFFNRK